VREYYLFLKNRAFFQHPDLQGFLLYFEANWIGTPPAGNVRNWLLPRVELSVWNVYDAVRNNQHRTNNCVEGWHTRFQQLIGSCHPNIYKFLGHLKKEEDMTRLQMAQMQAGMPPPAQKRVYRRLNQRILNVVLDFQNRTLMNYLRSIAHNLSFTM